MLAAVSEEVYLRKVMFYVILKDSNSPMIPKIQADKGLVNTPLSPLHLLDKVFVPRLSVYSRHEVIEYIHEGPLLLMVIENEYSTSS